MENLFSNAYIVSFSLRGKLKDHFNKKRNDFKNKVNHYAEVGKNAKNWLTDNLTVKDAQDFFNKMEGAKVKVVKLKLVGNKNGKDWAVLSVNLNPDITEKFEINVLHRNGNSIDIVGNQWATSSSEIAVEKWNSIKEINKDYSSEEKEETEETETSEETSNPSEETSDKNDYIGIGDDDTIIADESMYDIKDA